MDNGIKKDKKDKWEFLYWKNEKEYDSDFDVHQRTYNGTFEEAVVKFINFLSYRDIYQIDCEVRRESDRKCFCILSECNNKEHSEFFSSYM